MNKFWSLKQKLKYPAALRIMPMLNVFPRAERIFIEETIGYNRPSAHPPKDQICKYSSEIVEYDNIIHVNTNIVSNLPVWFHRDKLTKKEIVGVQLQGISNESIVLIRNMLIDSYVSLKKNITLKEMYEKYRNHTGTLGDCTDCEVLGFDKFVLIFDFYEDNKVINYGIGLVAQLETIYKSLCDFIASTGQPQHNKHKDSTSGDTESEGSSFMTIVDSQHVLRKYVDRDGLLSSLCSCNETAAYFSSDLFVICNSCYENKKFPRNYTPRNFHKITRDLLRGIWTKKEEYYLLKAIEQHGDDWEMVSKYINDLSDNSEHNENITDNGLSHLTKTREHCIFHFINMCILEDINEYHTAPFSQFPNQISTLIAFLSVYIDSKAASRAAEEFLQIMSKYNTQKEIVEQLIQVSVRCCEEIVNLEELKKEKILKVRVEAIIKKLNIKINAIKNMHEEKNIVKQELIDRRAMLMDEICRNGI